ncbi:MAG: FAD binding domain-containing protein [Actinomycetota bacterium]|nr:FAD binding domain-containing protein [Actinomycetota bacterium]
MTVARPTTLDQAVTALASMPDAQLLAGGTDFMVEVNFGHRRPTDVVALRRVAELGSFATDGDEVVLGANVTYSQMQTDLAKALPGLAAAARTVGSPQIRNAGTIGGNVATASPAGDTLPFLAAVDADVVLASAGGTRRLPLAGFITAAKRTAILTGELVTEVRFPAVSGPQQFLKVGTRNAMVISIACCAMVVDTDHRRVRCAFGSVAPRPLRPTDAEDFISEALDWNALTAPPDAVDRFAELAAAAAEPITDHRGTAEYRRHTVKVMARRALTRSLRA